MYFFFSKLYLTSLKSLCIITFNGNCFKRYTTFIIETVEYYLMNLKIPYGTYNKLLFHNWTTESHAQDFLFVKIDILFTIRVTLFFYTKQ